MALTVTCECVDCMAFITCLFYPTMYELLDFYSLVTLQNENCISQATGYKQIVTVCGSQRRHIVVTQRKLM